MVAAIIVAVIKLLLGLLFSLMVSKCRLMLLVIYFVSSKWNRDSGERERGEERRGEGRGTRSVCQLSFPGNDSF